MRRAQRLDAKAVEQVLTKGRSQRGVHFRLYFGGNGLAMGRVALIVAKRNAVRAVDRSYVRRLMREVFRKEQERWRGLDCVIRLISVYGAGQPYVEDLIRLFRRVP